MVVQPPLRSRVALLTGLIALLCMVSAPFASARPRTDAVLATSAEDPVLQARIAQLSPSVDPKEARQVVFTSYTLGRELAREWRMSSSANWQCFLVNLGVRKAGYCYQFANELLLELDALKLRTLELHWAEADPGTDIEHNVIVVTAKGQPFAQGILLDNWRRSGRLLWSPVTGDTSYLWKENKPELVRRLQWRHHYARQVPVAKPKS